MSIEVTKVAKLCLIHWLPMFIIIAGRNESLTHSNCRVLEGWEPQNIWGFVGRSQKLKYAADTNSLVENTEPCHCIIV